MRDGRCVSDGRSVRKGPLLLFERDKGDKPDHPGLVSASFRPGFLCGLRSTRNLLK